MPTGSAPLPGALQSVSELSPALRGSRVEEGRPGQNQTHLQVVRHAVGNPSSTARTRRASEGRSDYRGSGAAGRSAKRHGRRRQNAAGQSEAVLRLRTEEKRVTQTG